MIVDVQCEDDTIQIAQMDHEHPSADIVSVRFLKRVASDVYDFSDEVVSIPSDSICGFYDVETLDQTDIYVKVPGGYTLVDDSEDEDFTYSESDETESESESLVDEDEA